MISKVRWDDIANTAKDHERRIGIGATSVKRYAAAKPLHQTNDRRRQVGRGRRQERGLFAIYEIWVPSCHSWHQQPPLPLGTCLAHVHTLLRIDAVAVIWSDSRLPMVPAKLKSAETAGSRNSPRKYMGPQTKHSRLPYTVLYPIFAMPLFRSKWIILAAYE